MTRRRSGSPLPALMLLALAVLWALCGAPLTGAEVRDIPQGLARLMRQLPRRMLAVLRLWIA